MLRLMLLLVVSPMAICAAQAKTWAETEVYQRYSEASRNPGA